jgi:hypothetical protein
MTVTPVTEVPASGPANGPTYRPAPDVVSRQLDNQAVLVNLKTNRIFELNRTGARLWELVEQAASEAQIAAQLAAEFDVSQGQLTREVRSLIDSLLEKGLITSDSQGS